MESPGKRRLWTAEFACWLDAKLLLIPFRGVDMSNFLPFTPARMWPGLLLPPGMSVDPAALACAPPELVQRAQMLRSGTPALLSAWDQASAVLALERTGAFMASSRAGSAAALEACASPVEALATSLRTSALIYASAEAAAGSAPAVGGRRQAWMP
jgi:hypothetical protein